MQQFFIAARRAGTLVFLFKHPVNYQTITYSAPQNTCGTKAGSHAFIIVIYVIFLIWRMQCITIQTKAKQYRFNAQCAFKQKQATIGMLPPRVLGIGALPKESKNGLFCRFISNTVCRVTTGSPPWCDVTFNLHLSGAMLSKCLVKISAISSELWLGTRRIEILAFAFEGSTVLALSYISAPDSVDLKGGSCTGTLQSRSTLFHPTQLQYQDQLYTHPDQKEQNLMLSSPHHSAYHFI